MYVYIRLYVKNVGKNKQETIPTIESPAILPTEPPPRVPTPTPRVNAPSPRVETEPRLVVACPTDANFVNSEKQPNYPMPNYISQDEAEAPAHNTRARRPQQLSITQETILSCIEMSTAKPSARNLSSRKFPMQMLCEIAGAVMDANGELLQYRHLIKRKEYREVWSRSYGNELGRLAQGLPGRVEGTNTLYFILKSEVPSDRFKDVTYGQIVCNYRVKKLCKRIINYA